MNEDNIQISVIIPLYNKAEYVVRAVESVLVQSDSVCEIIVVDDGSTDGGVAKVESIGHPKIRLVRQPNGGPSSSRNHGIDESRGDYVAFLDADDRYLPGFIDEIVRMIRMFPSAVLYSTGFTRVWPDGKRLNVVLPRGVDRDKPQIINNLYTVFSRSTVFSISSSSCVRKKTMVDRQIYFPVGELVNEDHDVIFRLAEIGSVAFSPKFLSEYTQGVSNSLYSVRPDFVSPCYQRLAARMLSPNFPSSQLWGAVRLLSVTRLNVAQVNIANGNRRRALVLLMNIQSLAHVTYWLRTLLRICMPSRLFRLRWLSRI